MARPLSGVYSPLPNERRRNSSRQRRGSRSQSQNARRNSVAESYLKRSSSVEPPPSREGLDNGRKLPAATKGTRVRRWDGNNRSHTDWDFVRRDPELWFPTGDCLVHLHAQGQSRRGPSIRVARTDLEASNCMPFFETTLGIPEEDFQTAQQDSSSDDGGYFTSPRSTGKFDLYVAAPFDMGREDTFDFHLTTRNFFAWMYDLPLAGVKLGASLITLHERMNEYRPDLEQNLDDMLAYIDGQGYSDFRDCPGHALAVLNYAEKFQLAELWTDAYVHCAGMHDALISSNEFGDISRTTKALITRASLEMNVRLERSSVALAAFMEDDLANSNRDLPEAMTKHMERFRSFLQSFYVQKHGYWPPHNMKPTKGKTQPLSKHTLLTMYTDFRNLYEFVADPGSAPGMQSGPEGIRGSVDIAHAAFAFDKKNKYSPLPHSLPLLPTSIPSFEAVPKSSSSSYFFRFFHTNKKAKLGQRTANLNALQEATNAHESKVMSSMLVKEYTRFEREFTMRGEDDKLSAVDARMARWLVVYAQLQTLIDLTRAPEEVRDCEGVDYPLCCQTAGTPHWKSSSAQTTRDNTSVPSVETLMSSAMNSSALQSPTGSELTTPSISSAAPAPLDLERVATNKRNSAAITEHPMTPSLEQLSALHPPATPTPPSTTPSSIFRKTFNRSSTFLAPRSAPTPDPVAKNTTSGTTTPTPTPRPKANQKRNMADRFSNTTLNLIFAPQPVRPVAGGPENLLNGSSSASIRGEEKYAYVEKARAERPRGRSRKRLSFVDSLRGRQHAGSSQVSLTETGGYDTNTEAGSYEEDRASLATTQDVPSLPETPAAAAVVGGGGSVISSSGGSASVVHAPIAESPEHGLEEHTPVATPASKPSIPARSASRVPGRIITRQPPPADARLSDSPPGLSPSSAPGRAGSDGSGSPGLSDVGTPTSATFREKSVKVVGEEIEGEMGGVQEEAVEEVSVPEQSEPKKQRGDAEDLAMRWRGLIGGPFA